MATPGEIGPRVAREPIKVPGFTFAPAKWRFFTDGWVAPAAGR